MTEVADAVVLAGGGGGGAGPLDAGGINILVLVLIFAAFYFLVIRPNRKRQQKQRELVNSVTEGDRIVTIGGFHGTVREVTDDTMRLEVGPATVVTVTKSAVARRLVEAEPGTSEEGE